ncbi:MAG: sensor domain-containing diguanylate cyclase/phosphohydrolase [Sarcina sp.]
MDDMFKLLAENMIFPMWIKDKELNFIYANELYAELNDRTIDEIIGYKNEDIFEPSTCEIFTACSKAALENGEIVSGKMYTNKGYKEATVVPIKDKEGNVLSIYGLITDMNEIKEKEDEIKFQRILTDQMIDILPGMVFYKDKDGKFVYVNKEFKDFYEKKGINVIIGKTANEIYGVEDAENFMIQDEEIIKNKNTILNEVVFKDSKGIESIREIVKIPLLDEDGEVKGIIGRALDITEKKNIQKRLEYLSYTDILTGIKNRTYFEEVEKEYSKKENLPLGVIMGDVNGLKLLNDTFGHQEGDKLLKAVANVLEESCKDIGEVFRIGGDEFVILVPNSNSKHCDKIINDIIKKCSKYKNDLFNISISLGAGVKETESCDIYKILKEAEDKLYRKKLLQKQSVKSSILNLLKVGLGVRSVETEQHTERVMDWAMKIGEQLGLERSLIDELIIAAELHDIGKIGISESILLKPSKLTDEEYAIMKTHSEIGYRIVMASSELKSVAKSVLHHHEKWDGTGYPMGLKGEEIPLISRIINICDSYDVMVNDRVYKKAMKKEDAITELRRVAGTQFDPKLVELFINYIMDK